MSPFILQKLLVLFLICRAFPHFGISALLFPLLKMSKSALWIPPHPLRLNSNGTSQGRLSGCSRAEVRYAPPSPPRTTIPRSNSGGSSRFLPTSPAWSMWPQGPCTTWALGLHEEETLENLSSGKWMTAGLSDYASLPCTSLTPPLILSWTIKEQIPPESKGLSETHEQEERGRKQTNKQKSHRTGKGNQERGYPPISHCRDQEG